ncbi:uncharacterized protein LOC106462882 isoform X1 [Limulus polyphemus]|uniref:Uncharacterized protein LOC106462882 isoform X1 n=2 Tax=Limulus polyphemus TaxID=6850 RepID=A0ABM1BAV1_LIMPO|nr:uncharacterized protein LOC106462882 isoform X1 [Limulus polyphemus]
MALPSESDVTLLKGAKISVTVEEAIIDVLVVSFHFGGKVFQGALLEVNKKNCPFDVPALKVWDSVTEKQQEKAQGTEDQADKLHALRQRHTYFQQYGGSLDLHTGLASSKSRHPLARSGRDQHVRMRRLRPRQVLCSHCRSICNENSENVQNGRGRLPEANKSSVVTSSSGISSSNVLPSPNTHKRSSVSTYNIGKAVVNFNPHNNNEFSNAGKGRLSNRTVLKNEGGQVKNVDSVKLNISRASTSSSECNHTLETNQNPTWRNEDPAISTSEFQYQAVTSTDLSGRMILRKRKSGDGIENTEDPEIHRGGKKHRRVEEIDAEGIMASKDEICTPSNSSNVENCDVAIKLKSTLAKTSPVIKISFANPQGKDMVLKIPARPPSTPVAEAGSDTEGSWASKDSPDRKMLSLKDDASTKAARKALKKAKKEAQRKANFSSLSPNTYNGDSNLHKHRSGHHHKHKLKRKRRHKDLLHTNDKGEENEYINENGVMNYHGAIEDGIRKKLTSRSFHNQSHILKSEPEPPGIYYEDVKNQCLRQKLSINLKRLNAKAYMRCSPKYCEAPDEDSNGSAGGNATWSGSGSENGDVPDFPKHATSPFRKMDHLKPLMMRISTHSVSKCVLESGREMMIGDIVWGKIHGFPWWPGKVLALTVSQRDNGVTISQQAHVSWFGSPTSSFMPCNQLTPFIDDFKARYNKKKRGPYREAIRQATLEAHQCVSGSRLPPSEVGPLLPVQ